MKHRCIGHGAAIAVLLSVLALALPASMAQSDPVKDRRALMKEIVAKSVKLAVAMVKGEIPFDAGAAATAMDKIAGVPERFVELFPEGTDLMDNDKTAAKPDLWENRADFLKRAKGLRVAAEATAKAAKAGPAAFRNAFLDLVKHCKGCHEKYKEKRN